MLELIKTLRQETGAGLVDIKKAVTEAKGDREKAYELLRKRGQARARKKTDRETREGVIASYVHSNGKIAVLVKLYCETDFVARNDEFQALGRDIAMHIAASAPDVLRPEDVSSDLVAKETSVWREQLAAEGKPEKMFATILPGKEKKFRSERALLSQAFVKNPDVTVGEHIAEVIGKIGENIAVGDFIRFEL